MAAAHDNLVRYVRGLVVRPETDRNTDAGLLDRYVSEGDEASFAAMVDRHGPLVLHVCRRVLGDPHDAEDAFQSAFLILARKAARVRPRETLAAWLHGVAYRVALKARFARTRRDRRTVGDAEIAADARPDPLSDLSARELLAVVDGEVRRLPEAYRLPVILCCLEGRSLEEAAQQLGWSPGSVKGRLQRGRAKLHDRLLRRGLTLSAILTASELSRGAGSGPMAARATRTVQAAITFAAARGSRGGISAQAVALAAQRIKNSVIVHWKFLAVMSFAVLAAGFWAGRPDVPKSTAAPEVRSRPVALDRALPAAPEDVASGDAGTVPRDLRRVELSGRVFDPAGRPLAGARLYEGYSVRRLTPDSRSFDAKYPVRATTDADGRFQFTFVDSDLDARWLDDSRPAVLAMAGDFGPAWAEIPDSGEPADLNLRLVDDLPLTGRVVDKDHRPVAGVRVTVREVIGDSEEGVTRYVHGDLDTWYPTRWRGPLPEQPRDATTDADGRFRMTGLGRDRVVSLALEGRSIQQAVIMAVTRSTVPNSRRVRAASFEYQAAPARTVRGVVRDRDTGRPVTGAAVWATPTGSRTFTDGSGRFEIVGCSQAPQGCAIVVQPQAGQPYFAARATVPESTDLDPATVDVGLTNGITLTGNVIDRATGKPPRAATVEYYPLFPNVHSSRLSLCAAQVASSMLVAPSGTYTLAVLPGPGVVCVSASPRDSYAEAAIDEGELARFFGDGVNRGMGRCLFVASGPGGREILQVNRFNAFAPISPGEQAGSVRLDFELERAKPIPGTVVGPDGKPLVGVEVMGLTAMPDEERLANESFTVTGLNPRGARSLSFRHASKALGTALTVRGDESGPLTVRLQPCGRVRGRLVDRAGRPVPEVTVCLGGAFTFTLTTESDRGGRFCASVLPAQTYSLWLSSTRRMQKNVGQLRVQPGQDQDLGDLRLND
jgi:RNA polymerase sigma factor (sigma-70 family)